MLKETLEVAKIALALMFVCAGMSVVAGTLALSIAHHISVL